MEPEHPDRPPAGDETALPESYRRAMSSPPSSGRADTAIAAAMAEYDRLDHTGGRDTATVTSIAVRRWRPMAAAAAAVMILAAGSVVVLTDRGGSDQMSSETALEAAARADAPETATPQPAMAESATSDAAPADAPGDEQISAFAEGAPATGPLADAPEAAIAVPGDPEAPALRTPADLTAYARDYAGQASTMAGPSCAPENSTMLGHARYRDTDVAVVRLVDERVAAIDLDDCEIIAATG